MKVALIGNQNCGKTTLFNYLTGMNSKIGNWPGVTIEKKVGYIKGTNHEIVDLPGIYSLSPYSVEEEVSRKFIFDEKPDLIINIIDATSIERSLYLTTQLMELDTRIVIALNMCDLLEKKGLSIKEKVLSEKLGIDVVKISALKEKGMDDLIKAIEKTNQLSRPNIYDCNIENIIFEFENTINYKRHKRFVAVKLIEEDERFKYLYNEKFGDKLSKLKQNYDTDLEEIIATERYDFIDNLKIDIIKKTKKQVSISDKLDKIFLNKWLAIPIFALIMLFVYYLSVGVVGSSTVEYIELFINKISVFLETKLAEIGTSEWLISLITNGIVAGVGAILGFIPQLIILFLCISILETSGYMARIAMLLDKFFRKVGLSGKSLIPFIIGSGCSVPGIMGTRIIENQDEREITTVLVPFIPCSAKLPIIALFSSYFFQSNSGIVSASLYFLAIFIIIISAYVMFKIRNKHSISTYISELPEYKLPNAKYIFKDVEEKVLSFIKRAGSVILISSIVIWFMLSFSFKMEYGVNIENSILASIGKKITWFFYPMLGHDNWGAAVSALQGLVAKEQVISSMSVISGFSDNAGSNDIFSEGSIFSNFTASSAYAFMAFNLFSAPCFGAIAAMKKELVSFKKLVKAILFQILCAWTMGTVIYQIGSRLENGIISVADLFICLIILLILICIILNKIKRKESSCANCPYCDECSKNE